MYIQANIGRNWTDASGEIFPLHRPAWLKFQDDVKDVLRDVTWEWLMADVDRGDFQVHTGMGEWEGVKEESAHVSIYFDHDGRRYDDSRGVWYDRRPQVTQELGVRLSSLAKRYGQDAIAFVVTDSHLASR